MNLSISSTTPQRRSKQKIERVNACKLQQEAKQPAGLGCCLSPGASLGAVDPGSEVCLTKTTDFRFHSCLRRSPGL